ncbi:hypothetical protein [Moraxella equi]|uniref:Membrane-bound lysozyme-inhibitor of c-type lysozyme n=1 Tax=Moraxella equi TaxID=60442 RepID=A0A378QRH8_9GAMM|nr:hypothetical protein [Moraxella equi]OPH40138.1 hypothetical protein B5J93_00500 [Moraxella equi]STZ03062.1 Uncharacterised protein [Moraxella equi]
MKKFALPLILALMASPAFAETVFLCNTTNGKQVKLVDNGDTFTYEFGKGKKTELNFSIAKHKIDYTEGAWKAESGYYWTMPYKGNTYTVFSSMINLDENGKELSEPKQRSRGHCQSRQTQFKNHFVQSQTN